MILSHTCQPIQFTSIKYSFFIILGGYGHTGKWIQENAILIIFRCFKLSKMIERLLNQQLTQSIAKCTLTGLVQQAKKSYQKGDLKLCMCISHNSALSFHCHTCWLEFKMLLPPAKKQKTLACLREIQVHKHWTKVYSQKGLIAMLSAYIYNIYCRFQANPEEVSIIFMSHLNSVC